MEKYIYKKSVIIYVGKSNILVVVFHLDDDTMRYVLSLMFLVVLQVLYMKQTA